MHHFAKYISEEILEVLTFKKAANRVILVKYIHICQNFLLHRHPSSKN